MYKYIFLLSNCIYVQLIKVNLIWARNACNSGDYDNMGVNWGGIVVSVFLNNLQINCN